VRNITDIDDKIISAAAENGESIYQTYCAFHCRNAEERRAGCAAARS